MGVFDDIIVPKSYLKGLLTKDQEKLIKDNNYQTKSLENFLSQYKIYRQKLYVRQGAIFEWKDYSGEINFYTSLLDKDDNTWWAEFNFYFVNGTLDKKQLVKFEIQDTNKKHDQLRFGLIREVKKRAAKRKAFKKTFKYKFYEKIRVFLSPILEWVEKQVKESDKKDNNE